jgi:hypothetical protein
VAALPKASLAETVTLNAVFAAAADGAVTESVAAVPPVTVIVPLVPWIRVPVVLEAVMVRGPAERSVIEPGKTRTPASPVTKV